MAESDFSLNEYAAILDTMQQQVEDELEALSQKSKLVSWSKSFIQTAQNEQNNLRQEMTRLQDDNAALVQKLADEKRQREELEMKLAEMNKLSAGMAKKTSEEAMLKALRTYANTSKRKTIDKRIFAKTAILEMAIVNGLTLPPDLAATIDALDDEQAEPKTSVTVNAGGNYNDIHNNTTVNQKQ